MARTPQTNDLKNNKINIPEQSTKTSFETKDWGKVAEDLESYFLIHQQRIITVIGGILGIIALIFAYIYLYQNPRQVTAKNQIFKAEQYFSTDSLDKALKGDGNNPGFENILSNYSGTESANLAHYYLGSIYLRKGQFQKAIDILNDYEAKDDLTGSLAKGMIGDAYSELGNLEKALDFYEKAAGDKSNNFTSPMYLLKEGLILENQKHFPEALALYEKIKKEYNESSQAKDIDKYIARINQKI